MFLERYVFSRQETVFVEQQQGEQPGHAPVAVPEGMYAEKIENDAGDEQELVDIGIATGFHIGEFKLLHSLGSFLGRHGAEAYAALASAVDFQDEIVVLLVLAAIVVAAEGQELGVEGENISLAEIEILKVCVYGVQSIPVARNLSFIVVQRSTALVYYGGYSFIAGDDTLNGIGAFDRLYAGHLLKLGEDFWVGLPAQAGGRAKCIDIGRQVGKRCRQKTVVQERVVKDMHIVPAFLHIN